MAWALVKDGVIKNLIAYNGTDTFVPPDGMALAQVPDDKQIGDTVQENKK